MTSYEYFPEIIGRCEICSDSQQAQSQPQVTVTYSAHFEFNPTISIISKLVLYSFI